MTGNLKTAAASREKLQKEIDKREKIEEEIKESEKKYRSLTETASDVIISADCNGTIISWNTGAQTLFGYTTEEVMGKPLTILMPEKYGEAHKTAIKRACKTGILKTTGKNIEVLGLKKDGNEFPLELSLSYWKKDEEIFYSGIIRDITERRKVEDALLRKTHDLGERVKELNCLYSISKVIEHLDISIEDMFQEVARIIPPSWQYPEITCARIRIGDEVYTTENFRETTWRQVSNIVVQGEQVGGVDVFYLEEMPEMDEGPFLKEESYLINEIATRLAMLIERKKADEQIREKENQLRQSQKMEAIGTLAGGIAHDFNNMLTGIIGYTELTMESLNPEDDSYDNLRKALKSSYSSRDIVAQLLTFSRKTKEEKEILQLSDLTSDTLKLIGSSLPSNVSVEKLIDKNIHQILGNAIQIQQILMNLCINAGHAMPEGGTLKITLKSHSFDKFKVLPDQEISGLYAVLSVEDSGIGMDKDVIERVFEPFFTTKEVGKGTGLGLSTVFGIVKQHDGYITVGSKKGIGTIFHVYLPTVKKDDEIILETVSQEKPTSKKGEPILFEDKEKEQNRFEAKTSQEEFIINITGNNLLSKSDKSQILDYYVLARNDRKKIIINCGSDVEKHLNNIGFNKFLEVRPKPE